MATILVIDDNGSNRTLVVKLLTHEGHRLIEAGDGLEGLERARTAAPDPVISDILMPSMDGFEFVRRLRADPGLHNVAVIYTAHYHETEARNLAEACRLSRVIVRSSGAAGIVTAVSEVLAGSVASPSPSLDPGFDREHLQLLTNKLARKANQLKIANARFAALTELNVQLASEREPRVLLKKSAAAHATCYAPYLTERAHAALTLEHQLKRAIEQEEFVLYYQPKVDLQSRSLLGVEEAKFLRLLRCDQMRGYLISKPLSFADMTAWIGRSRGEQELVRHTS